MTSDPKHLPPRDCLVLYHWADGDHWTELEHGVKNGEHTWRFAIFYDQDEFDPSRVITWTELPEVE